MVMKTMGRIVSCFDDLSRCICAGQHTAMHTSSGWGRTSALYCTTHLSSSAARRRSSLFWRTNLGYAVSALYCTSEACVHCISHDACRAICDSLLLLIQLMSGMQHWKMGHVTRNLLLANVVLLCQFALFGVVQHNDSVLASFGFDKQRPALARFILFTVTASGVCVSKCRMLSSSASARLLWCARVDALAFVPAVLAGAS